ncbi:phosphoglycerate mutase [Panaeolus papilionaceus]|nr:phosphoglycerate mutase [Panaeolus papilionaceus]
MSNTPKNKVCMIIHDGWGIAPKEDTKGNAIENAKTPNMDKIAKDNSFRTLNASGEYVGLRKGLMGNSEVGHLNLGAGRIVWQEIVRIDNAIQKREFHKNDVIMESCKRAKEGNGRLHLLGLISDGGVHSHINHLFALIETAKEQGVPHTYIHFFSDGRDTSPTSGAGYIQNVIDFTKKLQYGEIADVMGRYYAMDRDKRWERIKIAVDGLVNGVGEKVDAEKGVVDEVKKNYEKDTTDEFLKPIIVDGAEGRIKDDDTLFFFNYRSDRMREIVSIFGDVEHPSEFEGFKLPQNLGITTMAPYKTEFTFPVAFPPQPMMNVLSEWLSKQGLNQVHVAETEKYAHVTFFFNGGVEKQFKNEERFMVPSPKVATYDKDPKMSVHGVADKVVEFLDKGECEFVMCNFAPPDMVGHTGNYDAAVQAITETDSAVGKVYDAAMKNGYVLVITADHGNAEEMIDPLTGDKKTSHTTNRVPFIIAAPKDALGEEEMRRMRFAREGKAGKMGAMRGGEEEADGALCDVAPTVMDIMGLEKPEEMTGRSLLVSRPKN